MRSLSALIPKNQYDFKNKKVKKCLYSSGNNKRVMKLQLFVEDETDCMLGGYTVVRIFKRKKETEYMKTI